MGAVHPPRDKQAHLDKPTLWVDQPTDESFSLLENALREDEPLSGSGESTEEISSLLEENARLRGLCVQLSKLVRKTSATQERQSP